MNPQITLRTLCSFLFASAALSLFAASTAVGAPDAPRLLSPGNNAEGFAQYPNFTWEPVAGAEGYEIEIAADFRFEKPVVAPTRVLTPRFVPSKPLYQANRFWRVRTLDGKGNPGAWSKTFTYKLHAPRNKINIPASATLDEIRGLIKSAPESSLVSFPAGAVYKVKPADGHVLTLEGKRNLIVDGNDSTFIIENPSAGFLNMKNSSGVTFRRLKIDYDPLPHSIGTVEAVTPNPSGVSTISLRRLPGYSGFDAPYMMKDWSWGVILDSSIPGRMKEGSPLVVNFPNHNQVVKRDPKDADLYTVGIASAHQARFFEKGDRVIIFARKSAKGLVAADKGCTDITYDRITAYAAPGGHFSGIGSSEVKILNCHLKIKDSSRFFAGNADGVHIRSNLVGPWIEGCVFEGLGDDGIALYNKGISIIERSSPDSLLVAGTYMDLNEGDRFVIFNPFTGKLVGSDYKVRSAERVNGGNWNVKFSPAIPEGNELPVGNSTWWQNAQLFNRSRLNAGFVIRNNTFNSIRRYAIVFRSTDGVVSENTITGSSNTAIAMINEPRAWANGLHSENVLILNNTISNVGFDASSVGAGSISVHLRSLQDISADYRPKGQEAVLPDRLHRKIRIEGNTISNWQQRAIFLRSARDCIVQNNTITSAEGGGFIFSDKKNVAILVDNTEDCVIRNNDLSADKRLESPDMAIEVLNSKNTVLENNRIPASR